MMMQRCHFEDPASLTIFLLGKLEICSLDHHGQTLHEEDSAQNGQKKFLSDKDGAYPDYTSKHQTARVSHKYLSREGIIPEKTYQSTYEGCHKNSISPELDAVVCTHVSNVFGFVLPIEEIAALCRAEGVPLIVDASQSAGILPFELDTLGAAFIAMPGHKGLYGPQGTGLLLCAHDAAPLLYGGTGSASLEQTMPDFLPDRLEAGTHNMPGIAGLEAGLRFVRERRERIERHERALIARAAAALRGMDGVTVYAARDAAEQVGVLSFNLDGREPEETADALAQRGFALRGGLHCAPYAHRTAGTLPNGTVRLSVSAFTSAADIDAFAHVLRSIVRG